MTKVRSTTVNLLMVLMGVQGFLHNSRIGWPNPHLQAWSILFLWNISKRYITLRTTELRNTNWKMMISENYHAKNWKIHLLAILMQKKIVKSMPLGVHTWTYRGAVFLNNLVLSSLLSSIYDLKRWSTSLEVSWRR